MSEPFCLPHEQVVSRRSVMRTGVRLAYAAPLISASFGLTPLRAGATDALSSEQAIAAAEQAAAENQPPIAVPGEGFEVTDTDGDGVETVTVDGGASADPDGTIVSYLWTFGDEWVASEAVATVTLPVGTHRLALTVTDDAGATDTRKIRIRVRRGEPAQEQVPVQDEVAPAVAEPTPIPEPTLPPAPFDVRAKQKFAEVALTWKIQPGTPAPFRIYRTIDDGQNRPLDELQWVLIWEEWEKLSYRDVAVEPGVPYLYVVRSFDGINESERSDVAAITLEPVAQPVEEAPVEEQVVEDAPVVEQSAVDEEQVVEDAPADEPPTDETTETT